MGHNGAGSGEGHTPSQTQPHYELASAVIGPLPASKIHRFICILRHAKAGKEKCVRAAWSRPEGSREREG